MIKNLIDIITDGTYAPSGENCQPWRFEVINNVVNIFNVPEADQSIYNYQQFGSFIAHGALLENMSISANKNGYQMEVDLFPDRNQPNLVATAVFTQQTIRGDAPLYPFIRERCTNRKKYSGKTLTAQLKNELSTNSKENGVKIIFFDDQEKMSILGRAAALNEKIIFENESLHDFFYKHILWNQDEQNATGFYIKSLEFLPQQLPIVKLLKNWKILVYMNRFFKISRVIARDNAKKYESSGTFFALTLSENTGKGYVMLGREFQRLWLTATKEGLAIQPCTGILFFNARIQSGDQSVFTESHIKEIHEACTHIEDTFGTNDTIGMFGRIGYAPPPSGRATRKSPIITNN